MPTFVTKLEPAMPRKDTMSDAKEFLAHYGVKGMKWGERRSLRKAAKANAADFDNRLDSIYDKSRGAMSVNDYNRLDTKDVKVEAGSELKRVSTSKEKKLRENVYASYTKDDITRYHGLIPMGGGGGVGGRNYKKHYELTLKATQDLVAPSPKARVDAFISLVDTPALTMKNGQVITGREYMAKNGYAKEIKTLSTQQVGLAMYDTFVYAQTTKTPLNSAYYNKLKAAGYNALIDDNDAGRLSDKPLIILNPSGTIKTMSVRKLSNDEILTAQKQMKLPTETRTVSGPKGFDPSQYLSTL
jgi:hypothetical protein